jgi:acid phosphatase
MAFLFALFLPPALPFDPSSCEPPYPPYRPRTDADLIQVQLITRHGARTPLHVPKAFSNIWQCYNTELSSFNSSFSHPVHVANAYGKSLYLGNCQLGQLLETGASALERLGSYMRRIYVDQLKFLPTHFTKSILKFRSTSTLRTLHSQMSFVRGFYPGPNALVIETADKYHDPWRRASALCPALKKVMAKLQTGSEFVALGLNDSAVTDPIAATLGVSWAHTNDVATSARCRGLPLPPNLTEKTVDAAVALKARQMQFVYAHDSLFPLFFSFSAAEMVNEITKRLNGESRLKFVHWSAHDGNILAFLGFLGHADGRWPPYGSYITVELWRFRKSAACFLHFRYNGELLRVPRFSFSAVVPLDDFRKFVKNHMPRMYEDCQFNLTKFFKSDTTGAGAF